MPKIAGILVLFLIVNGCSIIKKDGNSSKEIPNTLPQNHLIENTMKQNVTRESFFIEKADIIVSEKDGFEKLLVSIKHQSPDKYLISIRSKTGIEAVRIFISDDTILINDRINRNLYYGSTFYLKEKYGVTTSLLPLIFGDCVGKRDEELTKQECLNGIAGLKGIVSGIIISYTIDCKKAKVVKSVTHNSLGEKAIEFNYRNFIKKEDIVLPGLIEIKDIQRMTLMEIKIRKIEPRWTGTIEFIPGSRYDQIKLQ